MVCPALLEALWQIHQTLTAFTQSRFYFQPTDEETEGEQSSIGSEF